MRTFFILLLFILQTLAVIAEENCKDISLDECNAVTGCVKKKHGEKESCVSRETLGDNFADVERHRNLKPNPLGELKPIDSSTKKK